MGTREEKQKLREYIWKRLVEEGVARFPPPYGRIPNFAGAGVAAERLSGLEEWRRAEVVLANPDSPQRRVRELALRQGKVLIMATPKLKTGYLRIDPARVRGREVLASSIRGAFKHGRRITLEEVANIDFVVTGCVAVAENGARLGKGSGYGDREIAEVRSRFGNVPVATTVHELQVVARIPEEEHDQRVGIIATPRRVLRVG